MEDEDLVDVSVSDRNDVSLPQSGSLPGSVNATTNAAVVLPRASAVGGVAQQAAKITVKFRVNGNSTDIVSFTQDPKGMFALQMSLFCRSRGIVPEQCNWKYGGRVLCPTTTPELLGIRTGEVIIDVTVSKSKVATSRAADRRAKKISAAGRGISRRGRR